MIRITRPTSADGARVGVGRLHAGTSLGARARRRIDEGFFLYSEDTDVCAEVRKIGLTVRYAPEATAWHTGGLSAPRNELLAILAESRVRYVHKHARRVTAWCGSRPSGSPSARGPTRS